MIRLSLRNNWSKFKTSWNLQIILEESIECTSDEWKQNQRMLKCNQLDLESLGSWQNMPKNFPELQMNWLSLRNKQLKFKIAGKWLILLDVFIEYTPIY